MIDIKQAMIAFDNYVNKYDRNVYKINLRYNHTLRVSELCGAIALSLHLDDEKVALAKLIGLLHDIGRFEQIKRYNMYNDNELYDHGNVGHDILSNNKLMRTFVEDDKYDDLIRKAVLEHNKAYVLGKYTEEELLYINIVRDADKIDILYICTMNEKDITDEKVSLDVLECIQNRKVVPWVKVKTSLDAKILYLAFVYDLNFPFSRKYLQEHKYINDIISMLNLKQQETIILFEQLKDQINENLKEADVRC